MRVSVWGNLIYLLIKVVRLCMLVFVVMAAVTLVRIRGGCSGSELRRTSSDRAGIRWISKAKTSRCPAVYTQQAIKRASLILGPGFVMAVLCSRMSRKVCTLALGPQINTSHLNDSSALGTDPFKRSQRTVTVAHIITLKAHYR
jgi:hypothetical protein